MLIIPTNCQFEITQNCNHKCGYCYNSFRCAPSKDQSNLITIAKKIAENKVFYVLITGGEPFFIKNKLYEIAKIFAKKYIDFSINTNLTMSNREDLLILKDLGLRSLLVSVMSYKKSQYETVSGRKGSFEKMLEGIANACDIGIHIATNMVVTQNNKNEVYKTGEYLNKRFGNIPFCATPLMITPGNCSNKLAINYQEYISVLDQLLLLKENLSINIDSLCAPIHCVFNNLSKYKHFLKRTCVAGRSTFTVSSNGDIRPCSHSDEIYGNILNTSVSTAIRKMLKWQNNRLIPKECSECSNAKYCRGGCRVSAKAYSKHLNGIHPFYQGPLKISINELSERKIKEYKPPKVFRMPFETLKYREEGQELVTIYLNPHSHILLNRLEFNLTKLIYKEKYINYQSFLENVGISENIIQDFIRKLERKGLLIRLG